MESIGLGIDLALVALVKATRCTFRIFFFGGVASRVPWGWHDSYGETGNFGRVGDKSMFKMHKKAGVGREGDI